jgi:hypothetical protein
MEAPQQEPAPITVNSIADVLRIRARILADAEPVTDAEIKACFDFTRKARTAQTGAKPKASKKALIPKTMQDIFDLKL